MIITAIGFNLKSRNDHFFYKIKGSYSDYARLQNDYRHRIYYLNRYLPIYNKRVKNTAGQDLNAEIQTGYIGEKFRSILTVSNVNQKIGFFPGSHGIPICRSGFKMMEIIEISNFLIKK